ncbi:MAG TPA: sulfotransferase, partial [Terriglobales bacterium]|nr:sulfotransferase [Terriglobales bacterium]
MEYLKPILLSAGGRSGSTQLMALLGTDSRVAFDRAFPYENRYLTCAAKFALLMQRPDLMQFLQPQQLFELNYLGFGGYLPGADYAPEFSPHVYLPRADSGSWLRHLWRKFTDDIRRHNPGAVFYAEKAPVWLPSFLRPHLDQFTIYNFRDPRDVFLSSNAFMKKRSALGFARVAGDTDRDHARHIAQAFLNSFDNYFADRDRPDTLLVRYEDFVRDPERTREQIARFTSADLKPGNGYFNPGHGTAADAGKSLERWKREPISPEALHLIEGILQKEMASLGYPVSEPNTTSVTNLSFAPGGLELAKVEHSSQGLLERDTDFAIVQVRGPDFHLFLPTEPFEADQVKEIWASVREGAGTLCSLYWRRRDSRFGESSVLHVPYTPRAYWEMLTFPVASHP